MPFCVGVADVNLLSPSLEELLQRNSFLPSSRTPPKICTVSQMPVDSESIPVTSAAPVPASVASSPRTGKLITDPGGMCRSLHNSAKLTSCSRFQILVTLLMLGSSAALLAASTAMLTLVAMALCWPPGVPLTLQRVSSPQRIPSWRVVDLQVPEASLYRDLSFSPLWKAPLLLLLLLLPRPLRTRSPMVLPLLDVDLLEEVGLETAAMEDLWGLATLGFGAKVNPGARSDPPALWEPSDWSRFANARTRRAKERRASSATARNPASRQGCFRSPCETS